MSIPDRWLKYKPIGDQIKGTPFIAFKVPLSAEANKRVENDDTRLEIPQILEKIPNLGMIIDLTFTTKYYRPKAFIDAGIEYVKLMIPGKQVPQSIYTEKFSDHVNSYLDNDENKDKLIGVHCTHGVNRTGFLICHHMVTRLKMSPDEAMREFEIARGHPIERQNYRDALINLTNVNGSTEDNSFNYDIHPQNNYRHPSRDTILPPRYRREISPPKYRRETSPFERNSWRRKSPLSRPKRSPSPSFQPRRNSRYRSPPPYRRMNTQSRSPPSYRRRNSRSKSPPRYQDRNNGGYNALYRGQYNRFGHNATYSRNDRPNYQPASNTSLTQRDPLPSHDFGSRYSVMAELYSESRSPPKSRYSWRRPE